MDTIEVDGKSVEAAVSRGLSKLGVARNDVEVEVLDEGAKGFLFVGGRSARVRLRVAKDESERVRSLTETLFRLMDIPFRIEVHRADGMYEVEIDTVDADGLLIGRKGETLACVQHLLDRMANRGTDDRLQINVDVGGYRKRRAEGLRAQALELAAQVKETGQERSTEPLQAPDRRVVHLALQDDPRIRTFTVGDGVYRSVIIASSQEQGAAQRTPDRPSSRPRGFERRPMDAPRDREMSPPQERHAPRGSDERRGGPRSGGPRDSRRERGGGRYQRDGGGGRGPRPDRPERFHRREDSPPRQDNAERGLVTSPRGGLDQVTRDMSPITSDGPDQLASRDRYGISPAPARSPAPPPAPEPKWGRNVRPKHKPRPQPSPGSAEGQQETPGE